ncbi:MAG: PAS domain-containing protein [Defluviitaleaceae bacterium]|nr:PAS domain-containing protein [Defluviitaleaceae bacterium]
MPISESKIKEMINSSGDCVKLCDGDGIIIDVSIPTLSFFGVSSKEAFHKRYVELLPAYQPDGKNSKETMQNWIKHTLEHGEAKFDWLYKRMDGIHIDCSIQLYAAEYLGRKIVCSLISERASTKEVSTVATTANDAYDRTYTMLDSAPIGCWFYNSVGEVIDCNQHAVRMYEMDSKGEMSRSTLATNTPEYQLNGELTTDYATKAMMQTMQEGMFQGPFVAKTKNGREFVCAATMVRVAHGDDFGIMVYLRETDDDFIAARQLDAERSVQQRLQAMLDSSPVCTFIMDEAFNVVECNQVAVTLFEFRDKQHFINHVFEIAPQFDDEDMYSGGAMVMGKLQEAFSTGYAKFEWTARTLSQKPIPTEFTIVRVRLEEKNFAIIYVQDMRGHYELIEMQSATQQKLQAMLDSSPLACGVTDEDFNISDCNQVMVELFELKGKHEYKERFFELSPEYQPDGSLSKTRLLELLKETTETSKTQFDWMHCTLDGKLIPCEVTLRMVTLNGKPSKIGYLRDLRHQNEMTAQLEGALQTLKSRGELLNTVNNAAETLLAVEDNGDFENAIVQSMEMIGHCLKADSVALLRVDVALDAVDISIDSQWLSKYGQQKQPMSMYQKLPRGALPKCEELVIGGKPFNGLMTALPASERLAIDPTSAIQSLVIIPIFYQENLWGVFAVANCTNERTLSHEEMDILHSASLMITNVRHRMEQVKKNRENELVIAQAHEALKNREKLLSVVNQAAAMLLAVNSEEGLENAVMQSMEALCFCLGADRMNLHRTVIDEEGASITSLCEWSSELGLRTPQISMEQKIPFGVLDGFSEMLLTGKYFNGPVSALPAAEQAFLNPYDALKSVVIIPLLYDGQPWGIFSIDDCKDERTFDSEEMDILRSASLMIASAYRRVEQAAQMYRIEIAEESNRAKSRFLARMSHEIRTPVTAVMGISEIQLQNPSISPQIEEAFAKIYNSSTLLLGIINDILDHSKIESGKMAILPAEYDVPSLISDSAHLYFLYLGSKDIKFRVSVDEDLPATLIGDVLRIEQITSNLLSNAFKYTVSGLVELSFECHRQNDNYITLVITVRDTGLGMTTEQLASLYHEYERFHMNELHSVAGTGLGMAIVYGLVQMMGAQIEIESEAGKGTTAVVRIPQEIAGNEVLGKEMADNLQRFDEYTHVAAKSFSFVPEPMSYGKVLVVDDTDANLYVAKGLLAFYDLSIETCINGQEAIDKIKQGSVYDIIFMDHMMPGLDGLETMCIMREMGYTHPIVALTANALIGQAEKFIESGFDGFISKPIQTKLLNTVLIKYIRDKQSPEVIESARTDKAKKDSLMSIKQGSIDDYLSGDSLRGGLRLEFVKTQKNSFQCISKALDLGDNKTAHRLVHSLKGVAGLIGENTLVQVANDLEISLAKNIAPTMEQLSTLQNELTRVLDDIGKPEVAVLSENKDFDKNKVTALFDKLHPLLKSQNANALDLIDELRTIPETAILIRMIEDINFKEALKTLDLLREIFEV